MRGLRRRRATIECAGPLGLRGYAGRSPASLFVVGLVVAFVYSVSVSEPRVTNRASSVSDDLARLCRDRVQPEVEPRIGFDRAAVGNGRPNAVGRKPEHLRKPSFGRAEGDGVAAGLPRVRDDVAEPRDGEFLSVSRRRDGQAVAGERFRQVRFHDLETLLGLPGDAGADRFSRRDPDGDALPCSTSIPEGTSREIGCSRSGELTRTRPSGPTSVTSPCVFDSSPLGVEPVRHGTRSGGSTPTYRSSSRSPQRSFRSSGGVAAYPSTVRTYSPHRPSPLAFPVGEDDQSIRPGTPPPHGRRSRVCESPREHLRPPGRPKRERRS